MKLHDVAAGPGRRSSSWKAASASPGSACVSPRSLSIGKDGGHIWADRFDRDLTDIFAIQDEITHTIVEQLKVKLLPAEKKAIAVAPTENIEAYTFYLRGREFFHRTLQTIVTPRQANVHQGHRARPELCARLCRYR